MRTLTIGFLAATALASLSTARAADLDEDYLRGPEYDPTPTQIIDWSGFYIGGHGGYTSGTFGKKSGLSTTLNTYVENTYGFSELVSSRGRRGTGESYGALAGYNLQFDELVVGLEADYTHYGRSAVTFAGASISGATGANSSETLIVTGRSSTTVEDYGSFRARFGYAFENFMPYVTVGAAIGQVSFADKLAVQGYGYNSETGANHGYTIFNPKYPVAGTSPSGEKQTVLAAPITGTVAARSKTVGGLAFGGGLEYAITSNFLLRGEYQYVQFQDFNGNKVDLNTIRAGAAVKF